MKLAALAILLTAALAAAQSTTSAPRPSSDSTSATLPEKHRLGGGFKGLPVSAPQSSQTPAPKPPPASPKASSKSKPILINNETVGGAAGAPPPTPATAIQVPPPQPGVKDLQGHDEAYWRERARAARDRVEKAREAVVSTEADEHRLENDFYAWDDGQYRDRVIKPEWEKAKQALLDAKTEVAAAEAALDNLSEDARKAGALPGWIR